MITSCSGVVSDTVSCEMALASLRDAGCCAPDHWRAQPRVPRELECYNCAVLLGLLDTECHIKVVAPPATCPPDLRGRLRRARCVCDPHTSASWVWD